MHVNQVHNTWFIYTKAKSTKRVLRALLTFSLSCCSNVTESNGKLMKRGKKTIRILFTDNWNLLHIFVDSENSRKWWMLFIFLSLNLNNDNKKRLKITYTRSMSINSYHINGFLIFCWLFAFLWLNFPKFNKITNLILIVKCSIQISFRIISIQRCNFCSTIIITILLMIIHLFRHNITR